MTEPAQMTIAAKEWRRIQDCEVEERLEFWRFNGIPGVRGVTGTRVYVHSLKQDGKRVRIRSSKIDVVVDRAELTGQQESEYHYLLPAQRPVVESTT